MSKDELKSVFFKTLVVTAVLLAVSVGVSSAVVTTMVCNRWFDSFRRQLPCDTFASRRQTRRVMDTRSLNES